MIPKLIALLPTRFHWTLHNVVGHPLMEIFTLLGAPTIGSWFHDTTQPRD